jgi:hypothetical protein
MVAANTSAKWHFHPKLCEHRHKLGHKSSCGFDLDHFAADEDCTLTHEHTHAGRACSYTHDHLHEVPCKANHAVFSSPQSGRLYLGGRSWTFHNHFETEDPRLLVNILAERTDALAEAFRVGIDPASIVKLCLAEAPMLGVGIDGKQVGLGLQIVRKALRWMRLFGNTLEDIHPSVAIPKTAEDASKKQPVLEEILASLREIREHKASERTEFRAAYEEEEGKRVLQVSVPQIAPIIAGLEKLENHLTVLAEYYKRPRGRSRKTRETTFIREFARLAEGTGNAQDNLGYSFYGAVFPNSPDFVSYKRERRKLTASLGRAGSLARARKLVAGTRTNDREKLTREAASLGISQAILHRALDEAGLSTGDLRKMRRPASRTLRAD